MWHARAPQCRQNSRRTSSEWCPAGTGTHKVQPTSSASSPTHALAVSSLSVVAVGGGVRGHARTRDACLLCAAMATTHLPTRGHRTRTPAGPPVVVSTRRSGCSTAPLHPGTWHCMPSAQRRTANARAQPRAGCLHISVTGTGNAPSAAATTARSCTPSPYVRVCSHSPACVQDVGEGTPPTQPNRAQAGTRARPRRVGTRPRASARPGPRST